MSNAAVLNNAPKLMKALKFDAQDLEANRAGLLSEQQAIKLKRGAQSVIGLLWFFATAIIVLLLPAFRLDDNISLLCIPLLLMFTFLGIATTLYFRDAFPHPDQKRLIRSLRGRLKRHRYYWSGKPAGWRYKIGLLDEEFAVEREVYESFIEGACYTLYYDPRFKRLLSAEPASSGKRACAMTLIGFHRLHKKRDLYVYR